MIDDHVESALRAVEPWLDRAGIPGEGMTHAVRLHGGTQNLAISFRRGGVDYVLRGGPEHPRPATNRNLMREVQILRGLGETTVPHARLMAVCDDATVLGGSVFYIMMFVDGFNPHVEVPKPFRQGECGRELYFRLVDTLAELGQVDYAAVGLGAVGRPDGFLGRQVSRWLDELGSYDTLPGYRPVRLGDVSVLADWLRQNEPPAARPGLLHGDFHVGNALFNRATGDILAVLDWEMSTIGDPMIDLGLLIALLPDAPHEPDVLGSELANYVELPDETAIVDRYLRTSTRSVAHLDWYVAMAAFKHGIVLEGTYARAQAGLTREDVGERLGRLSLRLIERARHRIGRKTT
jgi:aminoglycoside phosphotransferase (APT) family kinase protein